ncbi:hypothetical protein RRG08_005745 [Elysia crispata]|uniref:Uncharacterized protein n=1 Tax=Elysia crispata TaxID=231223 RepID=A0AAE0YCM5_9GAST|nr:hypothetical protein RRG08_005745 [Elysia crispata]
MPVGWIICCASILDKISSSGLCEASLQLFQCCGNRSYSASLTPSSDGVTVGPLIPALGTNRVPGKRPKQAPSSRILPAGQMTPGPWGAQSLKRSSLAGDRRGRELSLPVGELPGQRELDPIVGPGDTRRRLIGQLSENNQIDRSGEQQRKGQLLKDKISCLDRALPCLKIGVLHLEEQRQKRPKFLITEGAGKLSSLSEQRRLATAVFILHPGESRCSSSLVEAANDPGASAARKGRAKINIGGAFPLFILWFSNCPSACSACIALKITSACPVAAPQTGNLDHPTLCHSAHHPRRNSATLSHTLRSFRLKFNLDKCSLSFPKYLLVRRGVARGKVIKSGARYGEAAAIVDNYYKC